MKKIILCAMALIGTGNLAEAADTTAPATVTVRNDSDIDITFRAHYFSPAIRERAFKMAAEDYATAIIQNDLRPSTSFTIPFSTQEQNKEFLKEEVLNYVTDFPNGVPISLDSVVVLVKQGTRLRPKASRRITNREQDDLRDGKKIIVISQSPTTKNLSINLVVPVIPKNAAQKESKTMHDERATGS